MSNSNSVKPTKKKNRKLGLYILCGALTIFILMLFISMNNIGEIFSVVSTARYDYMLAVIGLLLLYTALTPLTLVILAKTRKLDVSFKDAYVINMTEHFFNGITPFATGGQPFEVYAFNKIGVKPAESTSILVMNFIIMMFVTNIFAACSLAYYGRFITSVDAFAVIAIFGFAMNFLVFVLMVSLGVSARLRRIIIRILNWFGKFKLFHKIIEKNMPAIMEYFANMQDAFKELFRHKRTFLACIPIKAVTMAVYYAMTFYILRALNIDVQYSDMFFVICGSSFAITAVVWLPTPGSSGGIEFAFKSIFASLGGGMSEAVAYGGMLIWRLVSYYLLMLISLAFYVYFEIYYNKVYLKKHPKPVDDNDVESAEGESAHVVELETSSDVDDAKVEDSSATNSLVNNSTALDDNGGGERENTNHSIKTPPNEPIISGEEQPVNPDQDDKELKGGKSERTEE